MLGLFLFVRGIDIGSISLYNIAKIGRLCVIRRGNSIMKKQKYTNQGTNPARKQTRSTGNTRKVKASNELQNPRDVYFARQQKENETIEQLKATRAGYIALAAEIQKSLTKFEKAVQLAGESPEFQMFVCAVQAYHFAENEVVTLLKEQQEELEKEGGKPLPLIRQQHYEKALQKKRAELEEKKKLLDIETRHLRKAINKLKKDKKALAEAKAEVERVNNLLFNVDSVLAQLQETIAISSKDPTKRVMFATSEELQNHAEALEAKVDTLETAENAQKRAEALEAKVDTLETAENAQKRAEALEAKAEEQIAKLIADIVQISTQIENGLNMLKELNKAAVQEKEAIKKVEASLADMRRAWDASLSELNTKVDKTDENYKELARNITARFTALTATHHSDLEGIKREISTQSSSIKKGLITGAAVLGTLLAVVGGVAIADYVKDSTSNVNSNVNINNNQGYTNINVGDYKTITAIQAAISQLETKLENTDDESLVEKMEADITALETKLGTINRTTGWSSDENDSNNYLTGQPSDANGYNKNGEYVGQKESYTAIARDTFKKLDTLQAELNRLNGLQLDKYSAEAQTQIQADKDWLSSKIQTIVATTGWSSDANDMNNYLTGTSYDREGYDKDGYNKQGYNRDGFAKDGFNSQGYDVEGYDRDGYDKDGFNREGYDKEGFDREGYDVEGYDREGYNKEGFNREGYDKEGFNRDGYDKDGFNREGYDKEGFNHEGYDKEGYDREGYDKEGFNREGYDKDGFNREGYDKDGFNRDGYDKDGFNRDGYDKDGFNREGYDKEGYDREGYDKDGFNREGYDKEGYDREGYNKEGYDREGYDRDGWNKDGIHKETGTKYDPEGYNREGYDKYGYDRNGNSIEDNQHDADQNGNVSSDNAVDVNDKGPGFGMGF